MFQPVSTKNAGAVEAEVQAAYLSIFPQGDHAFVPQAFRWMTDCFEGKYQNYLPIDARYHDFEHTMQGTLCMVRLLHCRHAAGAQPVLTQRLFELGLLAILMHDTGYLKPSDDAEGTGAKYTVIHVGRSADFAAQLLSEKNFPAKEISTVQHMIRCTGVDATLGAIPFRTDLEKIVGHALGTGDLLGQMAADDYVEKLPILYGEFQEAAEYSGEKSSSVAMFSSSADLLQKTPGFWGNYVKRKLEREFAGVYKFLNQPYPDGGNWYLEKIEANIAKLRRQLSPVAAK